MWEWGNTLAGAVEVVVFVIHRCRFAYSIGREYQAITVAAHVPLHQGGFALAGETPANGAQKKFLRRRQAYMVRCVMEKTDGAVWKTLRQASPELLNGVPTDGRGRFWLTTLRLANRPARRCPTCRWQPYLPAATPARRAPPPPGSVVRGLVGKTQR